MKQLECSISKERSKNTNYKDRHIKIKKLQTDINELIKLRNWLPEDSKYFYEINDLIIELNRQQFKLEYILAVPHRQKDWL